VVSSVAESEPEPHQSIGIGKESEPERRKSDAAPQDWYAEYFVQYVLYSATIIELWVPTDTLLLSFLIAQTETTGFKVQSHQKVYGIMA
jgi:hypothetical protein